MPDKPRGSRAGGAGPAARMWALPQASGHVSSCGSAPRSARPGPFLPGNGHGRTVQNCPGARCHPLTRAALRPHPALTRAFLLVVLPVATEMERTMGLAVEALLGRRDMGRGRPVRLRSTPSGLPSGVPLVAREPFMVAMTDLTGKQGVVRHLGLYLPPNLPGACHLLAGEWAPQQEYEGAWAKPHASAGLSRHLWVTDRWAACYCRYEPNSTI